MILNQQTLRELFVGFSAIWQPLYLKLIEKDSDWKKIAMVVPSTTKENLYGWLSRWPKVREWLGDRAFKNLKLNGYRLTNRKFETSLSVTRDDIDDDQMGMYPMMIRDGWATAVTKFFCTNVFGLLSNGTTNLCFDGTPYFGANHASQTADGTTINQSNLIAGANPAWYLFDTSLKPLIVQERRSFEFKAVTNLTDSEVFARDEFKFGIDGRYNFGYAFWQGALRSGAVLNQAGFDAAVAQMMGVLDEDGESIGVMPNLLVVGVSNRAAALQSIKASLLPWQTTVTGSGTNTVGGNTNYNLDAVEVMVVPWLP